MQRWPRGALPKPAKKWQVESRHKHRQSPTKREREKKTVRERVRESGESDTCLTVAAAAWQASSGCRCSLSAHAYTMPGEARSSRGSCNQAARQRGNQAGTLAAPRATTFRFTCSGVIKLQFLYNIYTQWVVVAERGYPHREGGRGQVWSVANQAVRGT